MTEKRLIVDGDYNWVDTITGMCIEVEDAFDLVNELADENKQLKQIMQEVCELLEEEVDLFSDKATEHDMIAYTELRQLDNKDAYYMATTTKKVIKLLKGDAG